MNIRLLSIVAMFAAAGTVVWGQAPATQPTTAPATAPATTSASPFKTDKQRVGYALGLQFGQRLQGIDIDASAMAQGIKDSAAGLPPQMTVKEIDESLEMLRTMLMAKADAEVAAAAKEGETFLAENGKKEGVKTTASGLQYKVIKTGTGKMPKATDNVSVNYRGTLINGKEFDASEPGMPVSFPLNRVIPGWTEALELMHEGDKWQLFIPAKLAYGERSPSPDIAPNSVLVFEVELLQVK